MECMVCHKRYGDIRKLRRKGAQAVIEASRRKQDDLCEGRYNDNIEYCIHEKCRKTYTALTKDNKKRPQKEKNNHNSKIRTGLRSCPFQFENDCLICGKLFDFDAIRRHPNRHSKICAVTEQSKGGTQSIQKKILEKCSEINGKYEQVISARICLAGDISVAGAKYHKQCMAKFLKKKKAQASPTIPPYSSGNKTTTHPNVDANNNTAFWKLCDWLDEPTQQCAQHSLADLRTRLMTYLPNELMAYSTKHLKRRLVEHFGDRLTITESSGRVNVITFSKQVPEIMHGIFTEASSTTEDEKRLKAAIETGKMIRDEIKKETDKKSDSYPPPTDLNVETLENQVPSILIALIGAMLPEQSKSHNTSKKRRMLVVCICHLIMNAGVSQHYTSPILLAVGLFMHQTTRSKLLIQTLSKLGLCCSYDEVLNFQSSAVTNRSVTDLADGVVPIFEDGGFLQWIADNFDHNEYSLSGLDSTHAMGIITCQTGGSSAPDAIVKKRGKTLASEIAEAGDFGKIIKPYQPPTKTNMSDVKFEDLPSNFIGNHSLDWFRRLDTLWLYSARLNPNPPNWQGFMSDITTGQFQCTTIIFNPMIPLNPQTNESVYTTMVFVMQQAKKAGLCCAQLTFDQPLYLKAFKMRENHPDEFSRIHLRLGGFHQLMSFLGSGLKLMANSGVEDLWEVSYARNTIPRMMDGKAYDMAVRACLLTDAALHNLLIESVDSNVVPALISSGNINDEDEDIEDTTPWDGERSDEDDCNEDVDAIIDERVEDIDVIKLASSNKDQDPTIDGTHEIQRDDRHGRRNDIQLPSANEDAIKYDRRGKTGGGRRDGRHIALNGHDDDLMIDVRRKKDGEDGRQLASTIEGEDAEVDDKRRSQKEDEESMIDSTREIQREHRGDGRQLASTSVGEDAVIDDKRRSKKEDGESVIDDRRRSLKDDEESMIDGSRRSQKEDKESVIDDRRRSQKEDEELVIMVIDDRRRSQKEDEESVIDDSRRSQKEDEESVIDDSRRSQKDDDESVIDDSRRSQKEDGESVIDDRWRCLKDDGRQLASTIGGEDAVIDDKRRSKKEYGESVIDDRRRSLKDDEESVIDDSRSSQKEDEESVIMVIDDRRRSQKEDGESVIDDRLRSLKDDEESVIDDSRRSQKDDDESVIDDSRRSQKEDGELGIMVIDDRRRSQKEDEESVIDYSRRSQKEDEESVIDDSRQSQKEDEESVIDDSRRSQKEDEESVIDDSRRSQKEDEESVIDYSRRSQKEDEESVIDDSRQSQKEDEESVIDGRRKKEREDIRHSRQVDSTDEDGDNIIRDGTENSTTDGDIKLSDDMWMKLKEKYESLSKKDITPDDMKQDVSLLELHHHVCRLKDKLTVSRTAKLWMMFMDFVSILRMAIRAERTGNWDLHLQATLDMLPYFAAAGHNNYTKCCRLYLQDHVQLCPCIEGAMKDGMFTIHRNEHLFWSGTSTDMTIEQSLMRSTKVTGGLIGITRREAARTRWLLCAHKVGQYTEALRSLADTSVGTHQHSEMKPGRIKQDTVDLHKMIGYLRSHNPFVTEKPTALRNIATGVIADDRINVDDAVTIGRKVHAKISGKKFGDVVLKKDDQAKTFAFMRKPVKTGTEEVFISSQELYQRLLAFSLASSPPDRSVFSYELAAVPPSLFKDDGSMRTGQKSELGRYICKLGSDIYVEHPTDSAVVVDGCAILHRQEWPKVGCIKDICKIYVAMIYGFRSSNRSHVSVVFDSYSNAITKDSEQKKRRIQAHTTADVEFDKSTPVPSNKEAFLSNKRNKQRLINLIGAYLLEAGIDVEHAGHEGDADVVIVRKALDIDHSNDCTVVVADDTDIFILLIVHARDMSNIYLRTKEKVISISAARSVIGNEMIRCLLFAHAISGCDTTSKPFGIGKTKPYKELKASSELRGIASIFGDRYASKESIAKAGESFVKAMYSGGKSASSLDSLRYLNILSSKYVAVERMPPTSRACMYHALRVQHQVTTWTHLRTVLDKDEYGFKTSSLDGTVKPVMTDKAAAPEVLLKEVRCTCKRKEGLCKSCGCAKRRVPCSIHCACEGNCTNPAPTDI